MATATLLVACALRIAAASWCGEIPQPPDNKLTSETFELGRLLFYDPRLSSNGRVACATCHRQEYAFSSGPSRPHGVAGRPPARDVPTLANVAWSPALTWADPRVTSLELQMATPLFHARPSEMGDASRIAQLEQLFANDAVYAESFRAAFPDARPQYTVANMVAALASFERGLVSCTSPYDRFARGGDAGAISDDARKGAELFHGERLGCHHCHGGLHFTRNFRDAASSPRQPAYANVGLYNVGGHNAYPSSDTGLAQITGLERDSGSFRIPTLRNVALTAPYMHDGSVPSLGDVIDLYSAGGRRVRGGDAAGDGSRNIHKSSYMQGFAITAAERRQLLAFLHALTDDGFIRDQRFSNPWIQGTRSSGRTPAPQSTTSRTGKEKTQ